MSSRKQSSSTRSGNAAKPSPYEEEIYSAEPKPVSSSTAHDNQRIGDILRRVREHRGEDIESISDYLRIRTQYLVALENSQYEDLPADAYVIGFLRTYALYLGLDGRGAIDQYRREMAGRRKKPQLSMPQPMSEGQAPTIALLAGAAIAAVLIYALWYGLSTPETPVVEQPVPLPQTAQEIAPQTEALPTDSGITLTTTSTGAPLQDIAPVIIGQPDAKGETKPEGASNTVKTGDKEKEGTKDKEKGKAKPAETPAAASVPAPATPTTPAQQTTETPKAESKTDTITEGATPPPPPAPTAPEPKDKGKSSVTIRANETSWILVTDSKGVTVFDRTLKAGETYQVPSGRGLSLTTSNASGITFVNEGTELPQMKTSGKVVRTLSLEPDKLKARLSKPESSSTETPPQ